MVDLIRRNNGAVVAHFEDNLFLLVAVSMNAYPRVRLYRPDGLNRIFQEVEQDLGDQILVCMKDQIVWLNLSIERNMRAGMMHAGQADDSLEK